MPRLHLSLDTVSLALVAGTAWVLIPGPGDAQVRPEVPRLVVAPDAVAPRAGCRPAREPEDLPAAEGLLDPPRFHGSLDSLTPGPDGAPNEGEILYSVHYGEDGRPSWVARLAASPGLAPMAGVDSLVARHLHPRPELEDGGVRLLLQVGPERTVSVHRPVVCPVEPVSDGVNRRIGTAIVTVPETEVRNLTREFRRRGSFRVRVRVGPDGGVERAVMARRSGSLIQDRRALRAARDGRYLPALQDGVPIRGWYEIDPEAEARMKLRR